MNKLTMVSMAALCVLLTACSHQEMDIDASLETAIETRSSNSNNITVTFTSDAGTSITKQCTRADVDYDSEASASIYLVFQDNSTFASFGNDLSFTVGTEYELIVTYDTNNSVTVEDLNIDVCSPDLCYSNNAGTITGTGLSFIVEDDPAGL